MLGPFTSSALIFPTLRGAAGPVSASEVLPEKRVKEIASSYDVVDGPNDEAMGNRSWSRSLRSVEGVFLAMT